MIQKIIKNVIFKNKIESITSLFLAILSLFCIDKILVGLGTILGVYATILSIIVSATFISAQIAIDKFGTEVWKAYTNDYYIIFYFYLIPLIFILGGILFILSPNYPNVNVNAVNSVISIYFQNSQISHGIFGIFSAFLIFLITFSLFMIPKVLKQAMKVLNPEEMIINNLRLISESKTCDTKFLEPIKHILNDLIKNENYETLRSCLNILSGDEFKKIYQNCNKSPSFLHDYSKIIVDLGKNAFEKNYMITISALQSLFRILRIKLNFDSTFEIAYIRDLVVYCVENSTIELNKYSITGLKNSFPVISEFIKNMEELMPKMTDTELANGINAVITVINTNIDAEYKQKSDNDITIWLLKTLNPEKIIKNNKTNPDKIFYYLISAYDIIFKKISHNLLYFFDISKILYDYFLNLLNILSEYENSISKEEYGKLNSKICLTFITNFIENKNQLDNVFKSLHNPENHSKLLNKFLDEKLENS